MWNRAAVETRSLPKRFLGRVSVIPRRGGSWRLAARLIFESQFLRYTFALWPFVVGMLIWPELALPIAQAPIPMVLLIAFVEMRVLRMTKEARQKLLSEDDAARRLDTLAFRARAALRKIAARHDALEGELSLVVEQSELANVPPLTLVSVQRRLPQPEVMELTPEGHRTLSETLFDEALTERDLHAVNIREDTYLRSVSFDVRGVSAHARLAAMLETPPAPAEVPT